MLCETSFGWKWRMLFETEMAEGIQVRRIINQSGVSQRCCYSCDMCHGIPHDLKTS